jgi:hypothetical protein
MFDSPREVERVAVRVVVGALEYQIVDLDLHVVHPLGDSPCP